MVGKKEKYITFTCDLETYKDALELKERTENLVETDSQLFYRLVRKGIAATKQER